MHHAPALTLNLQPDPLWIGSLRAGGCAGVLATLGWLVWHTLQAGQSVGSVLAVAAVSVIPSVHLIWRSCAVTPSRTLSWQPTLAQWILQSTAADPGCPPRQGRIDCMVARQDWLLLRHCGPDIPSAWIPVSRNAHRADWHALRCAVFNPGAAPLAVPQTDE